MCQYVACANGGVCRQANTPQCFICDCQAGFTGIVCQIQEGITNRKYIS